MEELIQQLKIILGTNFALYLKAHNFHWNVEGTDFAQYHQFLGSFYDSVFDQNDDIAEHIRQLNAYAPGSFSRFQELSVIEEATTIPSGIAMFAILEMDNRKYMEELRTGIKVAEAADEPAVSNFLQDLLASHQKHGWMLRSFIK